MKITRDPRETAIHDGGSYATNFNAWLIAVNNIKVPNEDALSADDNDGNGEGVVLLFKRDENQNIVIGEDGEPETRERRGQVMIEGRKTNCGGCDAKTQAERAGQPWWYL